MAKRLGDCLVDAGVITETQLDEALRLQEEEQGFLGQILLDKGWISEEHLCRAISESIEVNCVSIENILIDNDIIDLISNSLAITCEILPLFVHRDTIYLAMENPLDSGVIQLVEYETGMKVKPLTAPPYQLKAMIRKYYQPEKREDDAEPHHVTSHANLSVEEKITREIGFGHRKRLGDVLVEAGLLKKEQVERALQIQKKKHEFLGQVFVELGWVTEDELCKALSETLRIESVNLRAVTITPEAIEYVSDSLAVLCNICPLYVEDDTLHLAMENPLDTGVIQLLQHNTGLKIKPLVAVPSQIRAALRKYYPSKAARPGPNEV